MNLLHRLCNASGRSWGLKVGVMLACLEIPRIGLWSLMGCLAWPLYS